MTKKAPAFLLLALVLAVPLALTAPSQAEAGSAKDIYIAPGATQDKIFSLGGHVVVEGTIREDVFVIGGSITVAGEVRKSVVGIGSRILVKSTAVVGEDVAALGGTLEKEPGCAIGGDTVYFQTRELGDRLFGDGNLADWLFSYRIIPVIIVIKLAFIFLWLVAAAIGVALFPKPIALAAGEIRKSFWPVLGIGLLAIVVFTMLVTFAALLSFVLIGIPIVMALAAAGFLIKVFGRLAVFYFLGDWLLRALGSKRIAAMGAVVAGLLVHSLITFVPGLGFLFGLVLNAVGWGVAIRTKFGSTENWFRKKPAC